MFQHQEKKETLVILRLCLMASIISLHMPAAVCQQGMQSGCACRTGLNLRGGRAKGKGRALQARAGSSWSDILNCQEKKHHERCKTTAEQQSRVKLDLLQQVNKAWQAELSISKEAYTNPPWAAISTKVDSPVTSKCQVSGLNVSHDKLLQSCRQKDQ